MHTNQCNVKCTKLINPTLAIVLCECRHECSASVQIKSAVKNKSNKCVYMCVFVFVQQSYSLVIFMKDAASCLFGFLEGE